MILFLTWPSNTIDYIKCVLFDAKQVTFVNQIDEPIYTITPGKSRGRLIGGNVLTLISRVGTPSFPDLQDAILFLEELNESYVRIARDMSHLRDAGVLSKLSGFVFGKCIACNESTVSESSTYFFKDLFDQHIKPLGIPAFANASIGYVDFNFPLPEGCLVEIDADKGTITMLEDVLK